jgi:NAD(P)-dependent dehydrogenase (short-subunit alcohol dehydrogenase family)/acyl carrier protein
LVRSAQAEHPGRFVLLDVDHTEGVRSLVEQALATGEPQLIARHGNLLVPRLSRLPSPTERAQPWDGEGTVLITGGTGGLGALIACHLVAERGARHLLLVSRSGARASGVDELSGRLRSNGATVSVTACDVSDRDAVADLLSTIPPQHPLTAVIHAAGVIDDGVIATLSKDRVERVFRPKVDGALLLDELTRHVELDAFVLFSSVAGVVGAAGQGNYAAANSALDAVAARRQERGRRGTSIAWGWWDDSGAMTRHLGQADRARLVASGLSAMPVDEGLALFDAAEIHRRPTILAARLDRSHPRASWSTRTVIPAGRRSHRLSARLAQALPADRPAVVLKAVLEETAAILGHATAGVEPERSFKDLGLDSLGAIELRNHLSASAGVRLPSTLVFDHPNPAAVSVYLLEQVASGSTDVQVRSADAELERLDAVLAAIAATGIDPRKLAARLTRFLSSLMPPADDDGDGDDFVAKVRDASAEEIFQLLDDNDRVRW